VGDAAVDPKRAVAMKGRYQKLEMSFDCGHLIEFALVDNASGFDQGYQHHRQGEAGFYHESVSCKLSTCTVTWSTWSFRPKQEGR
jgi:hypothetical protein